jgi:hypothetical protein
MHERNQLLRSYGLAGRPVLAIAAVEAAEDDEREEAPH